MAKKKSGKPKAISKAARSTKSKKEGRKKAAAPHVVVGPSGPGH